MRCRTLALAPVIGVLYVTRLRDRFRTIEEPARLLLMETL